MQFWREVSDMELEFVRPEEIERRSFEIIAEELGGFGFDNDIF